MCIPLCGLCGLVDVGDGGAVLCVYHCAVCVACWMWEMMVLYCVYTTVRFVWPGGCGRWWCSIVCIPLCGVCGLLELGDDGVVSCVCHRAVCVAWWMWEMMVLYCVYTTVQFVWPGGCGR